MYNIVLKTIMFYMVININVFLLVKKNETKIQSHLFICSQTGSVFGREAARRAHNVVVCLVERLLEELTKW